MAKKKYYAVKIGIKPGIYETWAECELQIKGVSGAKYKSFGTMAEAEKYIASEDEIIEKDETVNSINLQVDQKLAALKGDEVSHLWMEGQKCTNSATAEERAAASEQLSAEATCL